MTLKFLGSSANFLQTPSLSGLFTCSLALNVQIASKTLPLTFSSLLFPFLLFLSLPFPLFLSSSVTTVLALISSQKALKLIIICLDSLPKPIIFQVLIQTSPPSSSYLDLPQDTLPSSSNSTFHIIVMFTCFNPPITVQL